MSNYNQFDRHKDIPLNWGQSLKLWYQSINIIMTTHCKTLGKHKSAKSWSACLQGAVTSWMNSAQPQQCFCLPVKYEIELSHAQERAATQANKITGGDSSVITTPRFSTLQMKLHDAGLCRLLFVQCLSKWQKQRLHEDLTCFHCTYAPQNVNIARTTL